MVQDNIKSDLMASSQEVSDRKGRHFIEDVLFEKLLAIREEIYQKTDVNISPRKLVNILLEQSNFESLRDQLVERYS